MADLTIRALIERVQSGDIRVPAFQRDFVWDPEQIAFLMDSIYKNFPIGTVIFWQTDERLSTEKRLGNFLLPEPKRDYPVNYILDGQQRITSLFSTFQNDIASENPSEFEVFFDLDAKESLQDSVFIALSDSEADCSRHFPIRTFFDSIKYRKATENFEDNKKVKIDTVQSVFKEYRIPNETFEASDRNKVAIVFERINRSGTELDVFDLLAAWSWSEDFDLVDKFKDLQVKIAEIGYEDLCDDKDLQLRICAAVITGKTSPDKILDLQGDDIRRKFVEIENGIIGAIDFLKREIGVSHYKLLPFPGSLVPLSCFFSTNKPEGVNYSSKQKEIIMKWFWRSVFSRRFSGDVSERQASDIEQLNNLKRNEDYEFNLPRAEIKFDFDKANFSSSTVNSKALILMLAARKPQSFWSGAQIEIAKVLKKGSRHEFHHIFPRNFLKNANVDAKANVLANICFLTRSDNNKIRDKSPEKYLGDIGEENRRAYLRQALCPENTPSLDYITFLGERTKLLKAEAERLMGVAAKSRTDS